MRPVDATLALLARARPARRWRGVLATDGAGAVVEALYRGSHRPRAGDRRLRRQRSRRGALGSPAGRDVPGRPERGRHVAAELRRAGPGEALRLDAGNLHAYLRGAGIELMGASDNVVRGGLTVKQVDVDELLGVVDPTPLAEPCCPPATATTAGRRRRACATRSR